MADINAKLVQELREKSGAGMMECKKALVASDGDLGKAMEELKKSGAMKAEKRGDRATGAGLIKTYVHNERIGVMLDMRAETDFVVRSEDFQQAAKEIVMHIASVPAESVEELLEQPFIMNPDQTIAEKVTELIGKTGENIGIERFARFEV